MSQKIKNFTINFGPQHPAAHGVLCRIYGALRLILTQKIVVILGSLALVIFMVISILLLLVVECLPQLIRFIHPKVKKLVKILMEGLKVGVYVVRNHPAFHYIMKCGYLVFSSLFLFGWRIPISLDRLDYIGWHLSDPITSLLCDPVTSLLIKLVLLFLFFLAFGIYIAVEVKQVKNDPKVERALCWVKCIARLTLGILILYYIFQGGIDVKKLPDIDFIELAGLCLNLWVALWNGPFIPMGLPMPTVVSYFDNPRLPAVGGPAMPLGRL